MATDIKTFSTINHNHYAYSLASIKFILSIRKALYSKTYFTLKIPFVRINVFQAQ